MHIYARAISIETFIDDELYAETKGMAIATSFSDRSLRNDSSLYLVLVLQNIVQFYNQQIKIYR